ncbi:MAG: hypothetical protein A2751_03495 [Candidatus Doudnabacteria bacterium RIFCSPHIGHO2_01_FULL_46_14]|uniref:Uncharacterized protein n=1 Tax=Candidatus Doudnabacteria bacterium RIFCSPHIGHO2_01_FULL_46_14 TaxID=1817824 RepID=A0A1F5NLB2_9BACT|nr:MAG: hypothetical protein A2751_03495 [Candidatus Doudnabacteria bacterium RIFCSPHIGHO2_01_FULL_46_14]
MKIVQSPISIDELRQIAAKTFGDMVKIVVDLEKGIMAAGGELHADEEAILLDHGSKQNDLWGANIYINEPRDSWLVYDSMINLRPSQGNLLRTVQSSEIRDKITQVVNKLIQ